MIVLLTLVVFLATVGVLMALVYASTPQGVDVARRLSRVLNPPASEHDEDLANAQGERAKNVLVSVGKLLPPPKGKKLSHERRMLIRAGYRSEDAVWIIRGVRLITGILFTVASIWTGVYELNPIFLPVIAGAIGFFAPEFWLVNRVRARQKRLRLSLPDAMDLMVICVEVGLGLDQALMKVAEELAIVHPELSMELQMVNLEMRVGKTRVDALRELSDRTGLEDIKALVAILVQTDRFGTSIVQSLRIFSDELRMKRRQRAEEMSAKVSVKMVPPLVFLIFPSLMAVVLGPAIITIMRVLLPGLK
ncbi:MAG: type II secretion system F family protein [Candidatus Acidiferrales bacterium]|jgi:tight adherence protein C